jgi:putative hydrolase of the HAD superfamily
MFSSPPGIRCYDPAESAGSNKLMDTNKIVWPKAPKALLLDLGNVVLDVDFRRTFRAWAASAGVDEQRFHERWQADEHYERHERGEIRFREYAAHLALRFDVRMSLDAWRRGWNDAFVDYLPGVMPLLEELVTRMPVHCFTNTNPTHEAAWRRGYPELGVFHHIFVSSRIGRRKPDIAAYHYVAEQMGYAPGDIWFLDDNKQNVEGAIRAGLTTFRIRTAEDVTRVLARLLATAG